MTKEYKQEFYWEDRGDMSVGIWPSSGNFTVIISSDGTLGIEEGEDRAPFTDALQEFLSEYMEVGITTKEWYEQQLKEEEEWLQEMEKAYREEQESGIDNLTSTRQ